MARSVGRSDFAMACGHCFHWLAGVSNYGTPRRESKDRCAGRARALHAWFTLRLLSTQPQRPRILPPRKGSLTSLKQGALSPDGGTCCPTGTGERHGGSDILCRRSCRVLAHPCRSPLPLRSWLRVRRKTHPKGIGMLKSTPLCSLAPLESAWPNHSFKRTCLQHAA